MSRKHIYYGIQLYNPGRTPVTVKVSNKGFAVNDWTGTPIWDSFFDGTNDRITVPGYGSKLLIKEEYMPIPDGDLVSGVVRFETTGPLNANF